MNDKTKQNILIVIAVVVIGYLMSRKSAGKSIEVGQSFLHETYRELIINSTNMTNDGLPLWKWLARNTPDWKATAAAYESEFGGDLFNDLWVRLGISTFSEFTYELQAYTGQSI